MSLRVQEFINARRIPTEEECGAMTKEEVEEIARAMWCQRHRAVHAPGPCDLCGEEEKEEKP